MTFQIGKKRKQRSNFLRVGSVVYTAYYVPLLYFSKLRKNPIKVFLSLLPVVQVHIFLRIFDVPYLSVTWNMLMTFTASEQYVICG